MAVGGTGLGASTSIGSPQIRLSRRCKASALPATIASVERFAADAAGERQRQA